MAIQAFNLIGILFDTVSQTPVVIQCAQAVPEPEWKIWLSALAPWIGPLLSGVVSIYVAWKVFCWQGKKDHDRWVLDQKKAEWKELFSAVTEVQKEFPPIYETESLTIGKEEKMAGELANKLNEIEHRIDVIAIMPFIFIWQKLIDIKFYKNWKDFKEKASKDIASMPKLIENRALKQIYTSTPMKDRQTGSEYRDPKSVYCDLLDEYARIVKSMRSQAEADLKINSPARPL